MSGSSKRPKAVVAMVSTNSSTQAVSSVCCLNLRILCPRIVLDIEDPSFAPASNPALTLTDVTKNDFDNYVRLINVHEEISRNNLRNQGLRACKSVGTLHRNLSYNPRERLKGYPLPEGGVAYQGTSNSYFFSSEANTEVENGPSAAPSGSQSLHRQTSGMDES
ncbi:hypothetical protein Tco_1294217 [Tanacetum coccineum]